jgi:hypothetical protein
VFCQVSGANNDCKYYNNNGDIVQIWLTTAKLGSPVPATSSTWSTAASRTTRATTSALCLGVDQRDYAAMVLLSNPSVADHFKNEPKFPVGSRSRPRGVRQQDVRAT